MLQFLGIDSYGCLLWNFVSEEYLFYVDWRKAMHQLWRLPYSTHCQLLYTINNQFPIEISFKKRGVKTMWSFFNRKNYIVK